MQMAEIARDLQGMAANLALRMPISWINILAGPPVTVDGRMLDSRTQWFLQLLARSGQKPLAQLGVARAREEFDAFQAIMGGRPAAVSEIVDRIVGTPQGRIRVRIYRPAGSVARLLPAILYFHGGGWTIGSLEGYDLPCRFFCARSGCAVVAVDYRLAPEHRFPAALEDGAAALRAIAVNPRRFGVDIDRLGIAGDSAGANLAVVLACETPTPLALQLLLCPVMGPLDQTHSRAALASGWLIEEATMARYWDFYRVAGLAPDDPRVAPLNGGDLARLPPAIVHVAEFDPLRDEGEAYAAALTRVGVRAELTVHAGLIHHFYGLGGVVPAAQAAFARVCDGLKQAWAAVT